MANKVVKNTFMLYMMNIAKLIFPLVTLPYLTRILSTSGYGVVAYIKAVMQYMQILIDFGFILSGTKDIVLVRNDKIRLGKVTGDILAAKILLGIFAILLLSVMIVSIPLLRMNFFFTILSFIPVFLTCFLMDFYFRGIEKMEIITVRYIIMKGLSTILTFVMVRSDADLIWIPLLDIIGTLVAVMLVFNILRKQDIFIRVSEIKNIIIKIKESAIYFYSNIATTAFSALNTLIIGFFLDEVNVAYWSICMQLVTAVQSLYTPLTDGIYPQMVKEKNINLIKNVLKIFMPLISIGCIFTFCIAKYALLLVGGSKYIDAAPVLRCLIPLLFFSFPAVLFGWPTLGAIGKIKETTVTTIVSAFIQIFGLVILIVLKRLTLIHICILRDITEMFFFLMRYFLYRKYKYEFKIKER